MLQSAAVVARTAVILLGVHAYVARDVVVVSCLAIELYCSIFLLIDTSVMQPSKRQRWSLLLV